MKLIASVTEVRLPYRMPKRCLFIVFCFALVSLSLAQTEKQKTWEIKADTLLNHQEYSGALKLFSKILTSIKQKDKYYYSILYKSAVAHYSAGLLNLALKEIDEFIPAYPSFPQAHLLRAYIYRELEDAENQLINVDEVLALQPDNPELLRWRAMLYIDKEKFKEAKADLLKVKQFLDDAEAETYLGFAYYQTEKMDSALISFNKAIELDPTYSPAYLYAGSFCIQEEEYDLALKYINLALRVDPKDATAMFYKGVALVAKEKLDEGCSCLAKAFRFGMDDAGDYLKQYCYGEEN